MQELLLYMELKNKANDREKWKKTLKRNLLKINLRIEKKSMVNI